MNTLFTIDRFLLNEINSFNNVLFYFIYLKLLQHYLILLYLILLLLLLLLLL